ncbi:MAG: ABC transporter ATP-binding protein/permease [Butyrivibrio sp.]|jgi:ATP-binding cassette subfamily B protein|nr:ABC transporter ATP-binding protein/permease [Butyrivibrio sp.]
MAVNSFKEDENSSGVSNTVTLKRLLSYLLAYKKQIVIVLLIMAYASTVSLINPLIMESAIDTYIQAGDFRGLLRLAILAIVLNGTMVLLIRIRMYMMAGICNKVLLTIRQELYTHIQTLDFHFFDSRPNGKILARIIGDINSLKDVLNNFVTTLLPDAVTVIAVVVIMFIKNPKLAAASLISTPLMAIGIWLIQVKAHKRWVIFRKKSSNLNAYIHEDMSGIRIIQSFTAEPETRATFGTLLKEHRDSFLNAVRIADGFNSVIDFCWGLGTIAMFYVGIAVLGIGVKQVGLLVAFSSYISMFWNPIMNLSNFYNQLITNIAGAERVFEIMDTPSEITDGKEITQMPPIKGNVTFDHVSFSYDDKTSVLSDVSFDIRPGETIALVGPTGAGKTTIVSLISRFYDVQSGRVMIDGHDVRDVSIESLRSQMGIMTQDSFLFTGTVKDNIRYGKLDATDEEIIAAAKAVNAHDFIMQLKDGYDTQLSERGGGLSIGQKQLLAFARTMVSMPKILILDEATSSIDTQTELLVQKGIDALLKGRTSFVVAHRLSTIRKASRIFVVDHEHIIEEGTHDELLAQKGAYYRLYMAQFSHALDLGSENAADA